MPTCADVGGSQNHMTREQTHLHLDRIEIGDSACRHSGALDPDVHFLCDVWGERARDGHPQKVSEGNIHPVV